MNKQMHFLSNIVFVFKKSFQFSKMQYFLAALGIIWDSFLPFLNLYFPKMILDELSDKKRLNIIFYYIFLLISFNILIYIVKLCINILSSVYQNRASINEGVHYHLMNADMKYEYLESGKIHADEKTIMNNLSFAFWAYKPIAAFITCFIQLIGYSYILCMLNPIIVLFLVFVIFLSSKISKSRHKIQYNYEPETAEFNRKSNYLFNALIGFDYAKEIRINNAGSWILNKYKSVTDSHLIFFKKKQKENFKMDIFTDIIAFFQTIVVYVYSAYKVINQQISIGGFSVYVSAVSAFISNFNGIVDKFHQLKYISNYVSMYKNLIKISQNDNPLKLQEQPEPIQKNKTGVLEFQNVSFKYPNSFDYTLKNISFSVSKGEKISIVGYNGSGKSTIIKLICRLYKPTEGKIFYNGIDIWSISQKDYNNQLSVVFQDFSIFALSLKENICLNKNFSNDLMKDAIDKSDLTDKILGLPRNIDTQVSKYFDSNGIEFSGGEYQKVACARAYYKCGSIMLFDEPTAALDPFSEAKMYLRFNSIIKKKTAIYITHRLPIVKFCDKIIVLNAGKIIEEGAHDQLVNNNGLYAEMYHKQSEPYISH